MAISYKEWLARLASDSLTERAKALEQLQHMRTAQMKLWVKEGAEDLRLLDGHSKELQALFLNPASS